jgi:hypothetical protein
MPVDLESQLRQVMAARDLRPDQIDTSALLPVFVPAEFVASGRWCGPHIRLRSPQLGMTWAVMQPGNVMAYVTFEMQAFWDGEEMDWKRQAIRNLAAATNDREGARTLCRPDGRPFAIAFMYLDGLGTSRLLLRQGLEEMFPLGYRVALPERSCGFAFSADVSDDESRSVMDIVDRCHRYGTYPLLPGSYQADDLLPAT